jgi:hypothetical protein
VLERFNFYDVYAYLIPGLVLMGLAWLPYMVLGAPLPEGAVSEALVVVATAYVVGHVLHTFAKDLWGGS